MNYQTLEPYLNDLAAKKSVPGGGTAAALTAAQGVALLSMSCNFTIGKKAFQKFEAEIQGYLPQLESLRQDMFAGINKDIAAFKSVMLHYTKKTSDQSALEDSLKLASQVPLELIELCLKALTIQNRLLTITNPNLVSDVIIGKHLLHCAIVSSKENVEINLKSITDENFLKETHATLKQYLRSYTQP